LESRSCSFTAPFLSLQQGENPCHAFNSG